MNNHPVSLIVGADSTIGISLIHYLRKAGESVIGTTRRLDTVSKSIIYLDLAGEVDILTFPVPINVAYLCAGVTKLDDCKNELEESVRVNVHGVVALAKQLVSRGVFVVFLSTSQVFDGSIPYRKPSDPVTPITEYGRQKAEAERQISQLGNCVAIVRITKVIDSLFPLFSSWVNSLEMGEPILPFVDMRMAPVPLNTVISVLRVVADLRFPGVLQLSGEEDITYAETAYLGARLLGFDEKLVKPMNVLETKGYVEPFPANTTLNIDSLKHKLGIVPPDVHWTIKQAFKSL